MWAIPTGTSSVLKKKKKSPSPESRVPETGSDPPIGSERDSGRDIFLFRSPVGHIFILISRRTHTYSNSSYAVLSLYIYLYLSPVGHILMLVSDVYLFRSPKGHIYRTYTDTCLEVIII